MHEKKKLKSSFTQDGVVFHTGSIVRVHWRKVIFIIIIHTHIYTYTCLHKLISYLFSVFDSSSSSKVVIVTVIITNKSSDDDYIDKIIMITWHDDDNNSMIIMHSNIMALQRDRERSISWQSIMTQFHNMKDLRLPELLQYDP